MKEKREQKLKEKEAKRIDQLAYKILKPKPVVAKPEVPKPVKV